MDRDRSKKHSTTNQPIGCNRPSLSPATTEPAAAATTTTTINGGSADDEPSNKFNSNKNNTNDDKIINQCEFSDRQSMENNNTDFSITLSDNSNQNNCNMLSDEHGSSRYQSSSGVSSNYSGNSINGINSDVNDPNHYSHTSIGGSSSNDSDIDKDKSSDNNNTKNNNVASTDFTTANMINTNQSVAVNDTTTTTAPTAPTSTPAKSEVTNIKNQFNQSQIDDNNSRCSTNTEIAQSINGTQAKSVNSESNDISAAAIDTKQNNVNKCQEQSLNGIDVKQSENSFIRMPNSSDNTTKNASNIVAATHDIDDTAANQSNKSVNDFYSDDGGSKRVLYNEYVNLLSDADLSGMAAKQRINSKNVVESYGSGANSENKPLLYDRDGRVPINSIAQLKKCNQKPKSIVKSPSSQTFNGEPSKAYEINRKPRLSIQCSGTDPERPVLHVQFLSQHNQDGDSDDQNGSGLSKSYPPQTMDLGYQNERYANNRDDDNNNKCSDMQEYGDIGDGEIRRLRGSISSTPSTSSTSSTDSSDSSSSDEESSIGQFVEAKPPDGGWGWVVVFASFVVNLIADGITFSFGVIFVEFLEYFGKGKGETAWIGSLFMSIPLLSGPIASFLTDRYGCRKVTIAGSILAAVGFILSSQVQSIDMMYITFGGIAGFGMSLCYVAAIVIVAYYFDKRRSLATGLSVCGSGIGTFLFAPLIQFLLDTYGWRYTQITLAGIILNMCVCGMLMRDLEWTTHRAKLKAKQRKNKLRVSAESFSVSTNTGGTTSNLHKDDVTTTDLERSDGNGETSLTSQTDIEVADPRLFSSLISLPTFVKNGEKVPMEVLELLSTNRNIHNVLLKNYPGLAHSRSFSQPLTTSRQSSTAVVTLVNTLENAMSPTSNLPERQPSSSKRNRRIRNEQAFLAWLKENGNAQPTNDVRMMLHRHHSHHHHHPTAAYLKDLRMHRHSLTYRGAMLNINRYRLRASSCPDIYRNSMTTIAKEKSSLRQSWDEFKSVLLDMLDYTLFRDIRFVLFALSNFLLYTWYDVPYVYLPDYATKINPENITASDASMLISVLGIVNMFGEIFLGWLGDRKCLSVGLIYGICMVFCGLITGLVPLFKTFIDLSLLSGFFGLFIAANYALTSVILVELITLDRFTNAYGLLLLVQGIGNLLGPPLAGWISDYTKSYDIAFYLAGFFIILSGVLMMILPARRKIRKYRAIRRKNSGRDDDDDDDEEEEESEECDEDAERRLAKAEKINEHQTIMAPKSALKSNGTTKNYILGKNLLNNNDSTKIIQV